MIKLRPGVKPALASCFTFLALTGSLWAAPNSWTNSVGGLWRSSTNWSLASAPNGSSNVDPTQITNAGTKTVTIDAATASANLSIRSLTLSAPAGSTNTLALVDVSSGTPLTTTKPLLVGSRAVLALTNGAVNATDSFDLAGGSLFLHSGSLLCAINCDVQSGSIVMNSGSLTVAPATTGIRMGRLAGATTSLTLNGGTVNTPRITLGSVSGSQNSLTLAGGDLICSDSFSAAQLPSTTGNVTMTAGNLFVTNGTAKIADRAAATFSQSGGRTAFADLSIGDLGTGVFNLSDGQLTVTPRTNTDLTIIGNMENADFNQSGGVAIIGNELHVADFSGVTANLNLMGGQFLATNDLVAIGRKGLGTMTVSNSLVVLTNTSVGRHLDSSGIVTVQSNGHLQFIADLSLGRLAGSSGQLFINGGLLSITNDDLWVGRGGSGEMTVAGGIVRAKNLHVGNSDDGTNAPTGLLVLRGGDTLVSSGFFLGTAGLSTGTAAVSGGNLIVTNLSASADLVIASGTFTLDGGAVLADAVVLTNSSSQLVFDSGLLRAKALTMSNGQPFVVGDGVKTATLELGGGTYTFANGLVISPNASVTGCGNVIGNITNLGTYSNPCGQASNVTISSLTKAGNTVTVSFYSLNNLNHTLEFKNSLNDATWSAILPAIAGNGGVQSLPDTFATNATRFYRIHAQ